MTRTASSTGSLAASSRRWYPRSSRSDVTPAAALVSAAREQSGAEQHGTGRQTA